MARKIVVTSGKGGVGKTTIVGNLGVYLSSLGARVVLIDADFGLNNLDVVLGIENKILYDVSDVIDGRCRVRQALIQHPLHKNLYALSSNGLKCSSGVGAQNLKIIVDSLSGLFDYLILDCPAGMDSGFHRAVSCADEAVLVTTPSPSSLRDADKVISAIKSYRPSKISLVLNRVRGDLVLGGKTLSPKDVESLLKIPLIGVIPEDDEIFLKCSGFSVTGRANKAFRILAKNVYGGTKKIYDATARYTGFFGSIKRSFKKSV